MRTDQKGPRASDEGRGERSRGRKAHIASRLAPWFLAAGGHKGPKIPGMHGRWASMPLSPGAYALIKPSKFTAFDLLIDLFD